MNELGFSVFALAFFIGVAGIAGKSIPTLNEKPSILREVVYGISFAIAFAVLPLSHLFHMFYWEGSIQEFTDSTTITGIFSVAPENLWGLDGALFNTFEFTVALQVLLIGILRYWFIRNSPNRPAKTILIGDTIIGFSIFAFSAALYNPHRTWAGEFLAPTQFYWASFFGFFFTVCLLMVAMAELLFQLDDEASLGISGG